MKYSFYGVLTTNIAYIRNLKIYAISRQRPYHIEHTSSRPITEVKQCWARLVLGWVTAWEHWVLLAFIFVFDPATILPDMKEEVDGRHEFRIIQKNLLIQYCVFLWYFVLSNLSKNGPWIKIDGSSMNY